MSVFILKITVPQNKVDEIITILLNKKLACCIQQTKIFSSYLWNKMIENNWEVLLSLKTFEDKIKEIENVIEKHCGYEVVQVLGIKVDYVSTKYLNWMKLELRTDK